MTDYGFLTPEDKAIFEAAMSLQQTGGVTAGASVDRDWFLEEQDDSPEGIEQRILRLMCYMLFYFPRTFTTWEPINDLFFEHLEYVKKGLAWLPAQHGKSTMIQRWFIWVMSQEPNISIIYTEKNEPTAMRRARAIRMILEENQQLRDHFGEFKPEAGSSKPWSDQQFTIRQRTELIDTGTLTVFGAGGGSLLGNRCNILVVDDPVTHENSGSERERAKLKQWYSEAASTSPSPLPISAQRYLVVQHLVGTVFNRGDLFHDMLETGEYIHLYLKAVENEQTGKTLSPRYAYVPDLKKKAKQSAYYNELYAATKSGQVKNLYDFVVSDGRLAFNRRFQNIALDPSKQWCQMEWITGGKTEAPGSPPDGYPGCLDRKRTLGQRGEGMVCVTGCDPQSGSKSRDSVNFAALTIGAYPTDPTQVYIVDAVVGQYPLLSDTPGKKTQVGLLIDQATKYNSRLVIEANAVQQVWLDVLRSKSRDMGLTLDIKPHQTGKNKTDPNVGVQTLSPLIENGYLHIPYQKPSDQRTMHQLIDELVYYGVHPTSDMVMALWFAFLHLKKVIHSGVGNYDIPAKRLSYVASSDNWIYPPSFTPEQIADHQRILAGVAYDDDEEVA